MRVFTYTYALRVVSRDEVILIALGKQDTFVYNEGGTLKRYTVSTRTTTALLSVPSTAFFGAQISADGQWVTLNPFLSDHRAIQVVRLDGRRSHPHQRWR